MNRRIVSLVSIFIFVGLLYIPASVSIGSEKIGDIKRAGSQIKPQGLQPPYNGEGKVQLDMNFGKFPLYFIINKGQVNKKAKFYAKASRYTLWLTNEGLVFDCVKTVKTTHPALPGHPSQEKHTPSALRGHSSQEGNNGEIHRDVSWLIFLNANMNAEMVPVEEAKLRVNYFKGNDQSKWHCDVPTSQAVLYKNLYKDIDLKVYGIEKKIEYDWIVKPGGNPADIRFKYKNVKGTLINQEGNLVIETDFGELMHKKPVSYQGHKVQGRDAGAGFQACSQERTNVNVRFKKISTNAYGFEVGEYDKNYELIIDPEVLAYSTYLGGSWHDSVYGIAVDSSGYAYVAGYTMTADFPTLNQYQTYSGGYYISDTFLTKIDTSQSGSASLIYSTYLGGSGNDQGYGIAVDSNGNAYVTGWTDSYDFPTLNQLQTYQGDDAFVTKLDTTQSGSASLIYSTYLGGEGSEEGFGIAVDNSGNAYVTGWTGSYDFPTLNQFQTDPDDYTYDAFVTKIDTTKSGASSLIYSTYLGGGDWDKGSGIAVDNCGYAYVTGETWSTDFPTLNQLQLDKTYIDAFVTKIDTTKSGSLSVIYSTYLGGNNDDRGYGIAVDSSGYAYVTGWTNSTDFPTLNQFQTCSLSYDDGFITKIDTMQVGIASLIYSTYLTGDYNDRCHRIAVDNSGNAYVTGVTWSSDFPTLNQYQTNQGSSDAFVTKVDTTQSGTSCLKYSTYLGGSDWDEGYGIAVDNSGNVYVSGQTWSEDFPIMNQYQTDPDDDSDVFVTKLSVGILPTVTTTTVSIITAISASGGGNVTSDGGAEVTARGICWSTSENPTTDDNHTTDGSGTGVFTSSMTELTPNTVYYVRAYATNQVGTAYGNEETFETLDPSITVTSPNGGETWVVGTVHTITWTSDSVEGNVKIQYSIDNGQNWTGIISSTGNDGSFPWTVPAVDSNQCLIRVSETDGSPADTSNAVFTIFPPSITVTSPNGGENWQVNSQHTITWTCVGTVGNVQIEYSINNGDNWTEITPSTENDGSFPWTIPDTVSDLCLIKVSETDDTPADTSDLVFSIRPVSSITVTSPNGGENWDVGSVYDITWTSEGNVRNVRIEYSTNGGNSWKIITQSTENDGSYNWNVPAEPSDNCLVRISETDEDGSPSDVSDDVFSIVSHASGSITLRSPNGGETWIAGSTQEIKWKSTGDINQVNIKYSKDNGTTWKTIIQTTPNDGSYNWVVPETASDKCLVRVVANDSDLDPKPADVSDAIFSIILPPSPFIEVTTPNGGEQLVVGSRFTITWHAANTRNDVRIEYSVNGGETWREIVAAAENNGKYDWIAPDEPSDNCLVRIGEIDGQPSDVSDALFSIVSLTPGEITVNSPNGGETWTAGTSQVIKWTAVGIDHVTIEYSNDYGTTWKTIVQTTPNSGSVDWTVPDIASDECLVRITSNDANIDPIPADISDGVFSIVPPASPTITVIAPNGGEQLTVGSSIHITWHAVNSREDVKIEYSLNGGETWPIITDATENNGDYEWIVPDTPSEACLVRISEIDGQPLDISDAVFSIIQPLPGEITVTVAAPNGGESWTVGSLQEIKWTSSGDLNNVTIEYSTNYGTTWQVIVQTTENDGSFDWTIPDAVSNECLVRISSNDSDQDPIPSDVSDQLFSITPEPAGKFRVTSPNGGESWEVGSTQSIKWTNSGDINSVMIEYSYDNGNTWNTIVSSVSNSGTYDWQVPDTVSEECLVRVTGSDGNADPRPSDTSDAEFSIVLPSSPTIRVITPNGGEQLIVGLIYQITWFSTNSREPVKIEYSINGGETWTGIAGSIFDGDFDWLVPDEPSETCLVRTSEIDGQPVDVSDAVFSIVSPLPGDLTVLTPNGGENLETGSEYNISWTCSGLNNVIIEYSVNNGTTWLYIDKVPADNGSYTWTVPGTTSDNCLVRVTGADSDESPSDVSDGVFTIFDPTQASIEVFTPNGGESLCVGEEYYITWASSGINNVLIEYSTTNGEQWNTIDTVPAIGGRFTWTVPDTPSESCLIRISGADSPENPSDVSDSVFSITSN
jgi:hypothetical protein